MGGSYMRRDVIYISRSTERVILCSGECDGHLPCSRAVGFVKAKFKRQEVVWDKLSASGLVVKSNVAIVGPRVRFPAGAYNLIFEGIQFCIWRLMRGYMMDWRVHKQEWQTQAWQSWSCWIIKFKLWLQGIHKGYWRQLIPVYLHHKS